MTDPISVVGFQQFTSSFIRRYRRKLRYACVNLAMTVCAYEDALLDFFPHPIPGSGHSIHGNAEVLIGWIRMMKFERPRTSIVSAALAFTAFEGDGHVSDFLSTFRNCLFEIFGTAGIGTFVRHS